MNARDSYETLRVAAAQIAPFWLDRRSTINKVADYVDQAATSGCDLVAFGEALVPGYPFWVERTDGARFNSPLQKQTFARYLEQGVVLERGDLKPVTSMCRKRKIAVYLGVIERAPDRGGHSLYCSLVYIDKEGQVAGVHRKLVPTYEERLVWAPGDGAGLATYPLGAFHVGGLNCYENWIPLVRSALYAQGEDLHVATWPGGEHNTRDITRFLAIENRSYVISACGLLRDEDIGEHEELAEQLLRDSNGTLANGGSAIACPTGEWIVEPVIGEERLIIADLEHKLVREERHNFDLAGHYARPDITQLVVTKTRQTTISFE